MVLMKFVFLVKRALLRPYVSKKKVLLFRSKSGKSLLSSVSPMGSLYKECF